MSFQCVHLMHVHEGGSFDQRAFEFPHKLVSFDVFTAGVWTGGSMHACKKK